MRQFRHLASLNLGLILHWNGFLFGAHSVLYNTWVVNRFKILVLYYKQKQNFDLIEKNT